MNVPTLPLRLAYADPPYPGKAHLYREHPDYQGEVDHVELIRRLRSDYDGWALSTSAEALVDLLPHCPLNHRVLAWVKHTINVSWEPVIVVSAREPHGVRDWIQVEPDSYQFRARPDNYVIGQKPKTFCMWMFQWLGARPGDSLDDLFPGSGQVGVCWEAWRNAPVLDFALSPGAERRRHNRAKAKALTEHPTLDTEIGYAPLAEGTPRVGREGAGVSASQQPAPAKSGGGGGATSRPVEFARGSRTSASEYVEDALDAMFASIDPEVTE